MAVPPSPIEQMAAGAGDIPISLGSLRHRWRSALTWVVIGSCAIFSARYLQMRANYDLCEVEDPHAFTGPGGDAIEMDTRFCSLLAGDPGTIVVRFRPAGGARSRIVFAYNPTAGGPQAPNPPWYPNVIWSAPNRVLISTSQLSQIQRQRFEVGDVGFTYQIGKVDYPNVP